MTTQKQPQPPASVANDATGAQDATVLHDDRGDVPGWVLITLMTAGLVIAIWAIAAPALTGVFEQAIERVSGY